MNILVNSKYNPFTYQELTQPVRDYQEAYEKLETQFDDLAQMAEVWRDTANQEAAPEAYKLFSGYEKDLNSALEDFGRGMTPDTRRKLSSLKRRYSAEITPIAKADERIREIEKGREATRAADHSVRYRKENLSIDDALHGKTPDNSYISGKDVMNTASIAAAALAKSYIENDNPEEALKAFGKDFFEYTDQKGFTHESFMAALKDPDSKGGQMLWKIINDAEATSGIRDDDSQELRDYVRENAILGAMSSIGEARSQLVTNWRAQTAMQAAIQRESQRQTFDYTMAEKFMSQTPLYYMSTDGTVKTYFPISRTKDSKGNYSYDQTPTPKDFKYPVNSNGTKYNPDLNDLSWPPGYINTPGSTKRTKNMKPEQALADKQEADEMLANARTMKDVLSSTTSKNIEHKRTVVGVLMYNPIEKYEDYNYLEFKNEGNDGRGLLGWFNSSLTDGWGTITYDLDDEEMHDSSRSHSLKVLSDSEEAVIFGTNNQKQGGNKLYKQILYSLASSLGVGLEDIKGVPFNIVRVPSKGPNNANDEVNGKKLGERDEYVLVMDNAVLDALEAKAVGNGFGYNSSDAHNFRNRNVKEFYPSGLFDDPE